MIRGVTFKYDPFGRRIEKISPTTTSIFVYDGDNLIETTNGSGSEVASYTQPQDIDEPLATLRGTTTSYYEADGLGSITSLSNSSGSLVQTYTYDSFGNTTNSSGSLTNFFRYTGREFDTETGLYFNRARYYDATSGRFISEDPMEAAGGDLNFYRYVWNRTPSFIDPLGNWGFGVSGGGSAEGGVVVGAGATGSVGGGVFFNGLNPSVGGFASGGAFVGGPGFGPSAPSLPNKTNWVFGLFAGAGGSLWASNANNVCDLSGPFKTTSLNVGWGVRVLTIQYSVGQNAAGQTIRVLNYGGPLPGGLPTGVGWGASLSHYNTNTRTTAGKDCGCKK